MIKTATLIYFGLTVSAMGADKVLPPVEYDHPYLGELIIVQSVNATDKCPDNGRFTYKPILGCAFKSEGRCLILLAPDALIESKGWTREIVLRHERGHCNNWPAHHPGAR